MNADVLGICHALPTAVSFHPHNKPIRSGADHPGFPKAEGVPETFGLAGAALAGVAQWMEHWPVN